MADVQASWLAVARRELQEWPLFGGRGDIQSAIEDYSQLLQRNKSCEENVSRLESVNIKLRKEKVDLVKEISTVKQEAHQDILRAEAALKERIAFLETQAKELTDQLESTRQTLEDTTEQLSTTQEEIKQSKATIGQLEERNEQLNHDLEDMKEALSGETDARVAATSELEARLVAKERAESDKDKAEAQFRELKQNYLSKVDSLAKAQDAANEEFNKYKEMQRLLDLDRAAWDEQHKTLGRRSSNPAASFTLGSVFGGVANAIRGVGGQMQGGSGQGAQGEQQEDALASAVAAAKQQEQQQELLDVPLVPEEEAAVLQRHEKVHGGGCNAITFSPSGLHAATCGQDGVVRLWSTQDGTLSTELKPSHAQTASSMNAVAFAEDKSMVMGASNDKSIKTWDMHTGRPRFTMTGHTKAVLVIKQHPSLMNMAVSCGEDRLIKVWSLAEGICQRSILCKSKPLDVAFTRDGQCIVSAHYDGSLRVFDASTGSDMRVVDPVHRKEVGPCVAVAPTGHTSRVVSVGRDNVVCVTDIQQGEVVHRFSSTLLSVGTQRCTPAVAPDDSVVCVGSSSGMVLLLNMETGNVEARLSCHSSAVSCVAWNGHSEYSNVVAGSVDKRGDVIFWRAKER